MKKLLLITATVLFMQICNAQTITDIDGNVYNTVAIGTQKWMKENLKTTKYSDGTAIPLVNNVTSWAALSTTSKAYCWYNDDIANKATYGALYTWAAAMNGTASTSANPSNVKGICPADLQIPELLTKPALQPSLMAAVSTMVHSPALKTTVTGGVLRRAVPVTPGPGSCSTILAMQTGAMTIRRLGFLSVV